MSTKQTLRKKTNGNSIGEVNTKLEELNSSFAEEFEVIKQTIKSLQMQIQGLISKINRVETYQTQMDVVLRTHKHSPSDGGSKG